MSAVLAQEQQSAIVVQLSEVVEFNPKPARGSLADDLEVSFVPMAAVGAATGQIDTTAIRKFAEVKKGFTYFCDGDVLFAKITPCMENGKMTVAHGLRNGIGFGSTEFHVLRPRKGVDPRYVYHFVSSAGFRRDAAHQMTGAVGQKRVPIAYLQQCEIPLPSVDEQRRIVAEIEKQFSRLDEAVANLKRVKANLKRYKAAVLKAAVEGRLVPTEAELVRRDGRSYEPGEQLLNRILDIRRGLRQGKGKYKETAAPDTIDLPELTEGWAWASVDQVSVLVTDGDHNPPKRAKSGVSHLTAKHVRDWRLELTDCTFISPVDADRVFKRYSPVAGDLIVTCVGSIGRTAIVPEGFEFSPDRNLAAVRVLPNFVGANFLQLVLESPEYQKQMRGASGSTAQPHLYLGDLRALLIPLPPLPEQHRIVAEADRRLSIVREVEAEVDTNLKRAQALRQATLSKAFGSTAQ